MIDIVMANEDRYPPIMAKRKQQTGRRSRTLRAPLLTFCVSAAAWPRTPPYPRCGSSTHGRYGVPKTDGTLVLPITLPVNSLTPRQAWNVHAHPGRGIVCRCGRGSSYLPRRSRVGHLGSGSPGVVSRKARRAAPEASAAAKLAAA